MPAPFRMLRELGLNWASSCLESFSVEKGDLKRKRKSGEDSRFSVLFVVVGTGVFEGVAWPAARPDAFGGAVCAPNDWNPSQRASSRTLAVLA